MPSYLVFIITKRDKSQALRAGHYRIVSASSSTEAKRKGVEELVLAGKGIPGKTVAENIEKAEVSLHKS